MNNNASTEGVCLRPGGLLVVKFGGNAMTDHAEAALLEGIATLWGAGVWVVLVHGGGPQIDAALAVAGLATTRIDGLRVTDDAALAVTESVLCASINKRLVRALLARGVRAAGISGQDGALLVCGVEGEGKFGLVGAVAQVHPGILESLLAGGILPVVAPLGVARDGATAYNVNGDTAAGTIAAALRADALVFLTNVDRLRRDPDDPASGIDSLDLAAARAFCTTPACAGSMKPKMNAIVSALEGGVAQALITSELRPNDDRALCGGTVISA
ncbi:MAG TPA: acetylglutamate kinase [Candidatus Baltobacteraceae bacterium]